MTSLLKSVNKQDLTKFMDNILKNKELSSRLESGLESGLELSGLVLTKEKIAIIILRIIIIAIITIVIIIFLLIYYIITRFFNRKTRLWNYLKISGKFDKSTGLDLELAEKLSNALTNYITLPSIIIDEINYKSKLISNSDLIVKKQKSNIKPTNKCSKNSICSSNISRNTENITEQEQDDKYEVQYLNYLKKYLFENYNVNNSLYKLLRKFIEYGDIEYDSKNISESEKLKNPTISTNQKHMNKKTFNHLNKYF